MAVKVTVRRGGGGGNDNINNLAKKLSDPKPYLDMVGQAFLERARQRIATLKADPQGQRWAPWAPSTRAAREADGTAAFGLLFHHGAMYSALNYQVQGQKVVIQDPSPYGRYLQNGTAKMPARPFLGTGPWEERKAAELWTKWLKQK